MGATNLPNQHWRHIQQRQSEYQPNLEREMEMRAGKRGLLQVAQAFVTAGFLMLPLYGYSATDNAQERRGARDTRQDARQGGRDAKQDCRQADQKSNSDCRQDHREGKQDARKKARDIKY